MNWLIIGAGVSGLGATKFLRQKGEKVRVSDNGILTPDRALAFTSLGAELRDGGHDREHLKGIEAVIASPGLPASHPLLVAARTMALPIISEIDLALKDFKGRLVAVTGTNGKSTTCAMLGHMLAQAGQKVSVGGNFGDPPTALMADGRMGDLFIAELSSYQMETSNLVAPDVAIFTSFSHDHISRHGSMAGYLAAKWRVFAKMAKDGLAVLPSAVYEQAKKDGLALPICPLILFYPDAETMKRSKCPGYFVANDLVHFSSGSSVSIKDLNLIGWQNQVNAAYVICAASHLLGIPHAQAALLLKGFKGLAHRCELVGHIRGEAVINDSKSTNLESTLMALTGQTTPVLLMMGGMGKDEPYAPLLAEKSKIRAVVTFGASGEEIASAFSGAVPVERYPTLREALHELMKLHEKHPGPILFSPGCASFDEFDNFEHRGKTFTSAVSPHLDR